MPSLLRTPLASTIVAAAAFLSPTDAHAQFTFAPPLPVSQFLPRMAADVNGDGRADLISGSATIALNDREGTFRWRARLAAPGPSGGTAVGDLNGDGVTDVCAVIDGVIRVFLGAPGGRFVLQVPPVAVNSSSSLPPLLLDIDGDRDLDLCVEQTGSNPPALITLRNDGSANFSSPQLISLPANFNGFVALRAGDVVGDGSADLVAACFNRDSLLVLLNDGTTDPDDLADYIGAFFNGC